jgi:endonuclease/exonuclease/phosphatase family metal-dependent hydrolase
MSGRKRSILLVGDFNLPEINWYRETSSRRDAHISARFLEKNRQLLTQQLVAIPTHRRPGHNPTLIDLVITTDKDLIRDIHHHPGLGKSHHDAPLIEICCPMSKTTEPVL